MTTQATRATLADLARIDGKAELIGGRIVSFMPTGELPGEIAAEIYSSLRAHARATGTGRAFTDGVGFAVAELSSGRESFSPDAAYYVGPRGTQPMRFIEGPPTLAVEVRSENDYGPAAEEALAQKREDYFEAGTLVVWDVDPLAETISSYRPGQPPVVFRRGETADAEPAVPGWRVAVDSLFPEVP